MNHPGARLATAAEALIGCRFRLHGRDPETGLDCVGVVACALSSFGACPVVPGGYGLRNLSVNHWLPLAEQSGLMLTHSPLQRGDVVLINLAHSQHHLAIVCDAQHVVHAHAGLRRVVRQPLDPAWHVRAQWRIPTLLEG
jgi:cell wall-associated NlpC family hydrolase